jgi:hypothetical protein
VVSQPKSKIALDALKRHQERQLWEKQRAGARYHDQDLVLATIIGAPLDPLNVVNRHFKPLLRRP